MTTFTNPHARIERLMLQVEQLLAALCEAQEWNWFEPETIPGEVHQQMLDAMEQASQ